MYINPIPMRWGSGDNYCYLLKDDSTNHAWIIDPAEPHEVIPYLESNNCKDYQFQAVVNTHHHYDHSGGNSVLLEYFEDLYDVKDFPCIAGFQSPKVTYTPKHLEILKLGESIEIQALHTPCHTKDSICWYVKDTITNEKALFSGDTIFHLGNGRFFEGNGEDMVKVMFDIIPKNVDLNTRIFPGHEYTKSNAKFALSVLPNSQSLKDYIKKYETEGDEFICGMFTLKDELNTNPFFKLNDNEIIKATNGKNKSRAQIMDILREMKNKF